MTSRSEASTLRAANPAESQAFTAAGLFGIRHVHQYLQDRERGVCSELVACTDERQMLSLQGKAQCFLDLLTHIESIYDKDDHPLRPVVG